MVGKPSAETAHQKNSVATVLLTIFFIIIKLVCLVLPTFYRTAFK